MRVKLLIVALGALALLLTGFRLGALPYTPGQRFSDATTSHLPAAQFLRVSVLERGEFPLWRETIMAGQPFAADPLNKTAYPLQWLALLFPPALHLDLMILLHLFIAGAGMWTWARTLGLSESAAGLSALAYALSPRVVGHTGAGHLDLLYALAWFPWLMGSVAALTNRRATPHSTPPDPALSADSVAGAPTPPPSNLTAVSFDSAVPTLLPSDPALSADSAAKTSYPLPAAESPRRGGFQTRPYLYSQIIFLALFAALILLADIRLTLFAYTLAATYALYAILRDRRPRRLLRFIPAVALAAVLTLSVIVPLLLWRPYLSRADLTPQDAGVFALEPGHLLGLLLPPEGGNIETLTYVGLPVLALALVGVVAARQRFWGIAVLVAALYALGANGGLWSLLVARIPALLWFRVPSRAWFVVALIAPLLAGYGIQWLIDHRPRRGKLPALIGVVAALAAGVFLALSVPAINGIALIAGGLGSGVSLLIAYRNPIRSMSRERLLLVLILCVGVELAVTGRGWLEWRAVEQWQPPAEENLAQRLVELDAYRVYSPTYSLPQPVAAAYDLRLFGGVAPFQLRGIVAAISAGSGIGDTAYSVVQPPILSEDPASANRAALPDSAVLARWGVTHVVAAYPLDAPHLEPVDRVGGVYIYANRDPALTTDFGFPAWAASEDLPDAATVATLNNWTLAAALVSGAALLGMLVLLSVLTKARR